jgi:predicted ABC-type sugar transport system permease subunit
VQRLLPGLLLRLLLAPFLVLFGSVVSVFSVVVLLLERRNHGEHREHGGQNAEAARAA